MIQFLTVSYRCLGSLCVVLFLTACQTIVTNSPVIFEQELLASTELSKLIGHYHAIHSDNNIETLRISDTESKAPDSASTLTFVLGQGKTYPVIAGNTILSRIPGSVLILSTLLEGTFYFYSLQDNSLEEKIKLKNTFAIAKRFDEYIHLWYVSEDDELVKKHLKKRTIPGLTDSNSNEEKLYQFDDVKKFLIKYIGKYTHTEKPKVFKRSSKTEEWLIEKEAARLVKINTDKKKAAHRKKIAKEVKAQAEAKAKADTLQFFKSMAAAQQEKTEGFNVKVSAETAKAFSQEIPKNWINRDAQSPKLKEDSAELEDLLADAQRGDAQAQFLLAEHYCNPSKAGDDQYVCYGRGANNDLEVAAGWYYKAAAQGHAGAQFHLGVFSMSGIVFGIVRNASTAMKWYRKAAEQEHSEAQNQLGMAYVFGNDVEENHATAKAWFRRAADNGNAHAKANLEAMVAEEKKAVEARKPLTPYEVGKVIGGVLSLLKFSTSSSDSPAPVEGSGTKSASSASACRQRIEAGYLSCKSRLDLTSCAISGCGQMWECAVKQVATRSDGRRKVEFMGLKDRYGKCSKPWFTPIYASPPVICDPATGKEGNDFEGLIAKVCG